MVTCWHLLSVLKLPANAIPIHPKAPNWYSLSLREISQTLKQSKNSSQVPKSIRLISSLVFSRNVSTDRNAKSRPVKYSLSTVALHTVDIHLIAIATGSASTVITG